MIAVKTIQAIPKENVIAVVDKFVVFISVTEEITQKLDICKIVLIYRVKVSRFHTLVAIQ